MGREDGERRDTLTKDALIDYNLITFSQERAGNFSLWKFVT
jgi:hypothetical protein